MARRDQFGTSRGKYDDAFKSMVESVETRLDSSGKRIKIRDKNDLRVLFERLDRQRMDKKGKPRVTDRFIQKILDTRAADSFLGKTIGRFGGNVSTLKRQETPVVTAKLQEFKAQGKEVYTYEGGYATKTVYKSKHGKVITKFRSVKTGRFVKSSLIEE